MLARRSMGTVALYAVTGGVLILVGHPHVLQQLGSLVGGLLIPQEKSAALSSLLVGYGFLFLALGLLRYLRNPSKKDKTGFWDSGPMIWRDMLSAMRNSMPSRQDSTWLFVIVLVGLVLRGFFLAMPMQYDESYTFLHFVKPGLPLIFYYPVPNNHVLHTILVKLTTLIWGEHPVSLRLPAFFAGVASIPLTFFLCRTLGHRRAGFVASIGMSVTPYLVLFSCMARGYSLIVCLSLALALSAVYMATSNSWASCFLFSLVAALGLMTIPSMLFPIVGLYLWVACLLVIKGRSVMVVLREFVIPCSVMLYALTLILYTPSIAVSGGVESIVANRFVLPSPWEDFFRQMFGHLRLTLSDFTRDVPGSALFTFMVFLLVGVAWTARKRAWPALLLLPSLVVGSTAVFLIKHTIPFARTWIYFIPFFLVLADWGFTWLVERCSMRIQYVAVSLAICLSCYYSVSLMARNVIAEYPDTGYFPEASFVTKFLEPTIACNDIFYFKVPANAPMLFYLWYYGVAEDCAKPNSDARREFFIVKKSRYAIGDLTNEPVEIIMDFGDAAVYEALYAGKP